ncbi:MAG: hypothetical protein NVS1B11_14830 [Terriglobales bacterium]
MTDPFTTYPQTTGLNPTAPLLDGWNQWEGQSVNGEFPLRQYLGGSDHSAVYLTEQGAPSAPKAAIKFVRAGTNPEAQLSQWRSAAGVTHPGLLRIHKTGRCRLGGQDLLFVVMDYAEDNLSQILPQRVLTSEEAREMLTPTLEALAFLHAKGLVHGDLKPSNILAAREQIKLSSDRVRRNGESGPMGKPSAYLAPEHLRGGGSTAGDIWALGIVLCESLTGVVPVAAAGQNPALPKNLPIEFVFIASHCLERDPQRRWTAAEIGAGLAPTKGSSLQSTAVPPTTAPTPAPHSTIRRPVASDRPTSVAVSASKGSFLIPALLIGLILLALVSYALFHHRSSPPSESSEPANQPTLQQQPTVPSESSNRASNRKDHAVAPPSEAPAEFRARVTTRETAPSSDEIVHQVLPVVPQSAKNTIQGTIKVNVRVGADAAGNVIETHLDRSGPSKYFARLATQAAQEWKFKPQDNSGKRDWVLHFRFSRSGVGVDPTPVTRN